MRTVPVLITVLLLSATAAAQQPSGSKPAAGVLELMKSIVLPASNAIFGVAKETPKNDKEWTAVQDGAAKLNDAAKLLTSQSPSSNGANWLKYSKAMADAAETAGKAAQAKNADAVLDACVAIFSTCELCHGQYMKR